MLPVKAFCFAVFCAVLLASPLYITPVLSFSLSKSLKKGSTFDFTFEDPDGQVITKTEGLTRKIPEIQLDFDKGHWTAKPKHFFLSNNAQELTDIDENGPVVLGGPSRLSFTKNDDGTMTVHDTRHKRSITIATVKVTDKNGESIELTHLAEVGDVAKPASKFSMPKVKTKYTQPRGFNWRETTALIGAHTEVDKSGNAKLPEQKDIDQAIAAFYRPEIQEELRAEFNAAVASKQKELRGVMLVHPLTERRITFPEFAKKVFLNEQTAKKDAKYESLKAVRHGVGAGSHQAPF